jgi:hypothetical protein
MMTLVRSGVRFIMDHKTLDRLTALRGPGESYSNVILRMAKGWQLQSAPFLRNAKLLKASL